MRTAIASEPGLQFLTERLRMHAQRRAQAGHHAEAARLLQTVLDADADDLEVALRLAFHWLAAGQTVLAARAYLQAARILGRRGSPRRARLLVARAIELEPAMMTAAAVGPCAVAMGASIVPLLCDAADRHLAAAREEEARKLLRLAADADPMRVASVLRLVALELRAGNRVEAIERLDRLGRGLLELGRTRDFITVAERLIALQPDHRFFLRALGHAYLAAGRASRALPKLAALMRLQPRDPALVLRVAELYARQGQREASIAALARYAWLRLHAGAQHQAEVEAALDRAVEWIPNDGPWKTALLELGISTWVAERPRTIRDAGFDVIVLPAGPPPPPPPSVCGDKVRTVA